MGEKYCDDDVRYIGSPERLQLATLMRDPSGPGFPPPEYGTMLAWGPEGRAALQRYDARRMSDVQQMFGDATQRLTGAGTGAADRVAAGNEALARLESGLGDLQLHSAQTNQTLSMLDHEPTVPSGELADEARSSARRLKQSVTDSVGPFEQLVADMFSNVRDRAVNAVGAHLEEAANRIGQAAYTGTAGLYRAIRQRGLVDADGGPAEPSQPA